MFPAWRRLLQTKRPDTIDGHKRGTFDYAYRQLIAANLEMHDTLKKMGVDSVQFATRSSDALGAAMDALADYHNENTPNGASKH